MPTPTIKLFIIQGSQFCAKVMTALDSRQLRYTLIDVPIITRSARSKVLPSGGYLVPEMVLTPTSKSPEEVIPDSTKILQRLDVLQSERDQFYPTKEVQDCDLHISTTINALVLYFNHVSDVGFRRSIRAKLFDSLPPLVRNIIPYSLLLSSTRSKFREEVKDVLAIGEKDVNDRTMTKRLIYELSRYEEKAGQSGKYLFDTSKATAADCSLYAMLHRLVGVTGGIPPCLPTLWEEAGTTALHDWYQRMAKEFPLFWKSV